MSYRRLLKTALVTSLQRTFTNTYPEPTLRDLHVSIEYPVKAQEYPSIWVDFEESAVRSAGIDHREEDVEGNPVLRWRYEGTATYTIAALSSLERDRIYDELVKIVAFSHAAPTLNAFREEIEGNEFVALNFNFDEIEVGGSAASPGTPWETDEIIYETTLSMQVLGEFFAAVDTGNLVPLRRILLQGRQMPSTEEDPLNPVTWEIADPYVATAPPVIPPDLTQWH